MGALPAQARLWRVKYIRCECISLGGAVAALRGTKVFCQILNPISILALKSDLRRKLATGPEV